MTDPVYTTQSALMNHNEQELFTLLKKAIGTDYLIVPQVHLEKLVAPLKWSGDIKYAVGHVSRWSVDFALFDTLTMKPLLAIELNGDSHNQSDKMKRDAEVKKHLIEAGIPLLIFHNHDLPTVNVIQGLIRENINQND